nr:FMN-binding negative transcriptional regulator [Kibdelosporangium sp. MJ126-NF4]CEL12865.1 Transcriptional regulator [Kibdelosporangium sp. MJ126-NF4]CTQ98551.1 Transcriptional regulator [Kibdelosporangium sp. MJ126-NF4]
MHVPPMYEAPDPAWIPALIRAHPLATLVTAPDGIPAASHVPMIIRRTPDDERLTLVGHMNRMNPQFKAIGDGCPALLVFTGPHGYVSPTVYGFTPAAPTWNFAVVHASGTLSPLPAGPDTLEVIIDTVTALEGQLGNGWQMRDSLEYFDQLLPGVGAFSVQVDRVEAMYKLSQEQEPTTRETVAAAFEARSSDLAAMMRVCLDVERSTLGNRVG